MNSTLLAPPEHCCRSSMPLLAMALPDGSGLPQQDNVSCCTTKTAQEWPEEHDKELKAWTWPLNSPKWDDRFFQKSNSAKNGGSR